MSTPASPSNQQAEHGGDALSSLEGRVNYSQDESSPARSIIIHDTPDKSTEGDSSFEHVQSAPRIGGRTFAASSPDTPGMGASHTADSSFEVIQDQQSSPNWFRRPPSALQTTSTNVGDQQDTLDTPSKSPRARAFSAIVPRNISGPASYGHGGDPEHLETGTPDQESLVRRRASYEGSSNATRRRTSLSPVLSPIPDSISPERGYETSQAAADSAALLNPAASSFQPPPMTPLEDFPTDASFDFIITHGKNEIGDLTKGARQALSRLGLKSIPAMHGPLSLPYARCPSGIDAFLFSLDKEEDPWTFLLENENGRRPRPAPAFRINQVPLPGNARYSQPSQILHGRLPGRIVSAPAVLQTEEVEEYEIEGVPPRHQHGRAQRKRVVANSGATSVASRGTEYGAEHERQHSSGAQTHLAPPSTSWTQASPYPSRASQPLQPSVPPQPPVQAHPQPPQPVHPPQTGSIYHPVYPSPYYAPPPPPFASASYPPYPAPYPSPAYWPTSPFPYSTPAEFLAAYLPPQPPTSSQAPTPAASVYAAPTQASSTSAGNTFVDPAILSYGEPSGSQQYHQRQATEWTSQGMQGPALPWEFKSSTSVSDEEDDDEEEEYDEGGEDMRGGFYFPAVRPAGYDDSRRRGSLVSLGTSSNEHVVITRRPSMPVVRTLVAERRKSAAPIIQHGGPRKMSLAPAVSPFDDKSRPTWISQSLEALRASQVTVAPRRSSVAPQVRLVKDSHYTQSSHSAFAKPTRQPRPPPPMTSPVVVSASSSIPLVPNHARVYQAPIGGSKELSRKTSAPRVVVETPMGTRSGAPSPESLASARASTSSQGWIRGASYVPSSSAAGPLPRSTKGNESSHWTVAGASGSKDTSWGRVDRVALGELNRLDVDSSSSAGHTEGGGGRGKKRKGGKGKKRGGAVALGQ